MFRFLKSFVFAANGLRQSFKTELNFKIHIIAAVLVITMGYVVSISPMEWVALSVCIGMVLVAELFNTAMEKLVDMVKPQFDERAGLVKDIAAAAVLIAAGTSLVVALIIFVPKFV